MRLFGRSKGKSAPPTTKTRPPRTVRNAYHAASNAARLADLNTSQGSADYEIANALSMIRARVRSLHRNSGMMNRYLWLLRTNVVGPEGFRLQSRVRFTSGAEAGKLNTDLNSRVEAAWRDFCENPCVDGETDMNDLCTLSVAAWAQDGEVIWEIVEGREYRFGFAIDPIESDLLDETLSRTHTNGNEIRMGVEYDNRKRPVAYHFLTQHPGETSYYLPQVNARYRRVPAERVLRFYDRTRVSQSRGIPPSASVVVPMHMLDAYREAETVYRRLRAAIGGWFKRVMPSSTGVDEMADSTGLDHDGEEIYEATMEPGVFREIPEGLEPVNIDPGGSVSDFSDFTGQTKKDIASGMNLSTMTVGQEVEGVSYSSGRTIIIEDREFYKMLQSMMIRKFMNKVFARWFVRGALMVDDYAIPPSKAAAIRSSFKFRPRGWDWVDPTKDVSANAEALDTGQTTLTRIISQRGGDLEEMLDEREAELAAIESRPLLRKFEAGKRGKEQSGQANDDTQTDEDDE